MVCKSEDIERFDAVDKVLPAVNNQIDTNNNEGIPLPTDSEYLAEVVELVYTLS